MFSFLVNSDLSHYLDYESAIAKDQKTTDNILGLTSQAILFDDACECIPVRGLCSVIRDDNLRVHQLDYRNSGDKAGDRQRVVGNGSFHIS